MARPLLVTKQSPSAIGQKLLNMKTPGLNKISVLALLALTTVLLQESAVRAQPYSIDWYKIAGGGGTSTNGQYTLSGTIGQHDAGGPMTDGGFSLTGGFWALYAIQSSIGPRLTITPVGT